MSEFRSTNVVQLRNAVLQTGSPIIDEARERFNLCSEWEASWRPRFIEDMKFAHGDSYNGYQWPDRIRQARDLAERPSLTMNVIRQHNLMIVNEAKRAKSTAKVLGLGNGATQESANVVSALIRHIEHKSHAQLAYTVGREFQVFGGIGWWRIVTDYVNDDSFDLEIKIEPILDPLAVYMDPNCKYRNCSDAKFAFVFDFKRRDEFYEEYPGFESIATTPFGMTTMENFWMEKDHIMVCEYFRVVQKQDELASFVAPGSGQRQTLRRSRCPSEVWTGLMKDKLTRVRDLMVPEVEWRLIAGDQVIDETIWAGKYIPLIRCVGEEVIIDGILDRKGHTRALVDSQRMYNYNASASVEFGALQTKTPWVAPAKAIEEHSSMWNSANVENHSVLVWNHVDDDNPEQQIPPPFRAEPPQPAPLFESGMQTAFQQMMMTSGQWQNQMGMMGNERTGKAIQERQEQSDTATYHFQDHYEDSLKFTYRQIIDLIPKIYDTNRVMMVLADDGTDMMVEIDPGSQLAYQQWLGHQNNVIRRVLNPALGEYDIAEDIGPADATRRKETVEAMTLILTQAPGLAGIIGDLLLSSMDFDKAQEAALRLKRMVPPIAMGTGPTQNEAQLQQQLQAAQSQLALEMQRNARDKLKLISKDEKRDIEVYQAETNRIKAFTQASQQGQDMPQLVEQLVADALATHLNPILAANYEEEEGEPPVTPGVTPGAGGGAAPGGGGAAARGGGPPMAGAQQAPDGNWYLSDPTRRGRYLRIMPLAQQRAQYGGTTLEA